MTLKLMFSIFACVLLLSGTIITILLSYSTIRDIIDDLKRWYKGDDWGWTENLEGYGYQRRYG